MREQRRRGLTRAKVPAGRPKATQTRGGAPAADRRGGPAARRRRRDRRGRGARGPLAPRHVPLADPDERFDGIVLDAVEHVEERWHDRLAALTSRSRRSRRPTGRLVHRRVGRRDLLGGVPLARLLPPGPGRRARIVIYRRPFELRALDREDLEDLVHDIVVEEVAHFLGMDPAEVDPEGYGSAD